MGPFFKVRKVQFRSLLHILYCPFIYSKSVLVNILLIGMELLQDSANEL